MTQALEAQQTQRKMAKRATFDAMKGKKRKEDEFEYLIDGEPVSFLFRAYGGSKYDKLITECPPDLAGQARGEQYDEEKFAPALLSRVCIEPELSIKQWEEIWKGDEWSRGERMGLFGRAVGICLQGLDTSPTVAG